MRRFFCPSQNISGKHATINDKSQLHHLKDVLRLKPGAKVVLFDDAQKEYRGIIEQVSSQNLSIDIETQRKVKFKNKKICLAAALPKRAKFDFILQKATELGVETIIPLITERTIEKCRKKKE